MALFGRCHGPVQPQDRRLGDARSFAAPRLPLTALVDGHLGERPDAGLIHHSDRGIQYAVLTSVAQEFDRHVRRGLQLSMSRKADGLDCIKLFPVKPTGQAY